MNQNNVLSDAVRSLRQALHESQQAFAYRMRTAVKTIARYETQRPPKGSALANLARVARAVGQDAIAEVFQRGLLEELGALGEYIVPDAQISLNRLYLNRGDGWLADQIREFLTLARRDDRILYPLLTELNETPIDSEVQRNVWERDLIQTRLRAGQSAQQVRETFALEYAHDTGITEDQAMDYTRSKFPDLWPADSAPAGTVKIADAKPKPSTPEHANTRSGR